MVNQGDPTVYPCGRGFLPGTQGQGGGGSEPTTTPVILVANPPKDPRPPFIPSQPKPIPTPIPPAPGFPGPFGPAPPPPGDPRPPTRGPTTGGPVRGPTTGVPQFIPQAPPAGPTTGGPPKGPITGGPARGPVASPPSIPGVTPPPPPVPTGPTTGGTQFYKCEAVSVQTCPGEQNLPLNQATITGANQACVTCSPVFVSSNGQVVNDPACVYTSQAQCALACASFISTNVPCPPFISTSEPTGGTTSEPNEPSIRPVNNRDPLPVAPTLQTEPPNQPSLSVSVANESRQITQGQQAANATVISAEELVQEDDFRDLEKGIVQPSLFDAELNFFKSEPDESSEPVSNNLSRTVFKSEITSNIAELLSDRESTTPWRETTLQSLSDDHLLSSLNSKLTNTFEYLRHMGGRPIEVPTLLNVVRKHILQGTLDEFDVNYYIEAAAGQIEDKFEILEKPNEQEYADRLAITYLINNLYTYQNNKSSSWRNFQINRTRPLNEDVKLDINITTLAGDVKDLSIPNEGFQVDTLSAVDQVTVPSVGAPNKLNIGNGGGYYVDSTTLNSSGVAVPTNNIIPDAYYAPPPVRVKVLEMLGVDPAITVTASSVANQHEFQPSDAGASAVKPLFFAINLSSVTGDYFSDSLVENYSATYSLLTASSDIQTHLNNNALNTPMLCIDYRDPIYRYILDTSSLTASLNDFNLNGFKDKGFSAIGSRFVRNIPFGFVVTPVAGGRYDPFNGNSNLEKYGETHVRSLSVIPAPDASVDGKPAPMFRAYSLNKDDGVNRVGIAEDESTQNIGYRYVEEDFTQTFYSASAGSYGYSSAPPSAQGTAYMLREVIDYLSDTYSATTLTWYDIFSRMPVTRVGEMFYDSDPEFILEIANGLRNGIKIENIEAGFNNTSRIIAEDSKTIVTTADRRNVTKFKI